MKRLITLSIVLLTGCLEHDNLLKIDSSYTEGEEALIRNAAKQWYEATGGTFEIDFAERIDITKPMTADDWYKDYDDYDIIFKANSTDSIVSVIEGEVGISFYGVCGYNVLLVADRLPTDEDFLTTLLHEFGHYAGLHHLSDGIMSAELSHEGKKPCLDEFTMNYYCKYFACGESARSTCE